MTPSREMSKDQSVTRSEDSMPGISLARRQVIHGHQRLVSNIRPLKPACHAPTEDFAVRSLQYATWL